MQVAFAKLKLPVTQRQLRRVAEALLQDMHGSKKTQMQTLRGQHSGCKAAQARWDQVCHAVAYRALGFHVVMPIQCTPSCCAVVNVLSSTCCTVCSCRLDDTVVLEAVRFEDFQELVQKYINNQKQQKSGRQETLCVNSTQCFCEASSQYLDQSASLLYVLSCWCTCETM